ncbi:MAG: flagellar motor switch protein FliN [Nitrospinae bacterium]|nr:flagellar motor switch protein FliN [Nitrospinota bacterium]
MVEADEGEGGGKVIKATGTKPTKTGKGASKYLNVEFEKMERILDIPLVLSAQLGSSRMLVKELLQLGPGSVVELDKLAGEPLEVLVNDKLVARGEVVMVNDKFGVRLTDVVSPTERVQKLR